MVPNKFAALNRDLQPKRSIHRSRRTIEGFGVHDVIVETPDHSQFMVLPLMTDAHVADVLRTYKSRFDALSLTRASPISPSSRIMASRRHQP